LRRKGEKRGLPEKGSAPSPNRKEGKKSPPKRRKGIFLIIRRRERELS